MTTEANPFDQAPSFRKSRRNGDSELGQLPPHSIEAEQGVLGCILLDPVNAMNAAIEKLRDGAQAFYDLRHQTIYTAFLMLEAQAKPIDLISLQTSLRDHDELASVGGLAYVAALMDAVPSAQNIEFYLDTVVEKALLRRIIQGAVGVIGRVREHQGEVGPVVDQYVNDVLALTDQQAQTQILDPKVLVRDAIDHVEMAFKHRNQGLMLGLTTGWSYYDKKTGGLEDEQLYIIAGRPSTGKTSWACSLLLNVAVRAKIRVGFISIEMSRRILTVRMLCSLARANLMEVNSGFVSQRDFAALTVAAGELGKAPWDIIDTPSMTPAQLRAAGRRLVARGCKLIIIDHLHEVAVPESDGDEKVQAAEATRAARWIARVCKVPVVALAQLSRNFEQEAAKSRNRIPRMTDLRGSGYMEQMADLIGILYKDEERVEEDESDGKRARVNFNELKEWPVTLEICKQRNGPTGPVKFTFLREYLLYLDAYLNTGGEVRAQRKAAALEQEHFDDGPT